MGCQCSTFDHNEEIKTNITEPLIDVIRSQFEEYKVLMYSKSDCQDSQKAKLLFRQNSITFEYFEVDNMHEGPQLLSVLQKITHNKSTPFIFIKGKFYGSLKELNDGFSSGDLGKMLRFN
jgi:glutaredoxin